MRKKVKQVLCMFSALVVIICCAVPAFADDTVVSLTDDNISGFIISSTSQSLQKQFGSTDYAYVTSWRYRNGAYDYMLLVFDSKYKGSSIPDDVLVPSFGAATVFSINDNSFIVNSAFNSVKPFNDQVNIRDTERFYYQWFNDPATHIVYSNVSLDGLFDIADPNAVPAPFTVTYTPELSLNMQNKIYYPSKGGANADENGLVSAENNNINLDIKLTPEFLKTFNEKDLGKAYGSGTYAVLCCLSKNLLNSGDDLQRFFDEDVVLYAMNHDGNYYKGQDDEKVKSDGSASDDLNSNGTVDTFEPYLTLYQGRTPIYTIPRDGKLTVAFDLTSIDYETHGLTDDSQLYVNVIGVFVKNNGHVNPQNGENTEDTTSSTWLGSYAYQEDFTNLKSCEKLDDFVKSVDEETGKPETFKAYRVYSVISDPFSYEKFPDYVPKVYKDKDGNTYNPSTTKLKDLCNIPPSKVTDVDLAKGSDGVINDGSYMQPDDYNKYLDKKKINANFGSVDFTDIKSIFSTTGTYWDFLTAALSCLPSWFYAVFSAWFVLFLAIALIKLVIPG